jgi:hypothetical protein
VAATLGDLLRDHPPEVVALALRLRDAIRAAFPEAEERVYLGWEGLGFTMPGAGYVCAVFPRDSRVDVGLEHGAELEDVEGLFSRGGKQLRYVEFHEWDDARVGGVLRLIEAAVAMQTARRGR